MKRDDPLRVRLDVAGYYSAGLQISSQTIFPSFFVPEEVALVTNHGIAKVDEPVIEWQAQTMVTRTPKESCLPDFLGLASANPNKIEAFARRWGVLANQVVGRFDIFLADQGGGIAIPGPVLTDQVCEPISVYTRLARQYRALLALAADLSSGTSTRMEDWGDALQREKPSEFQWKDAALDAVDVGFERFLLANLVTGLLDEVTALPVVCWTDKARLGITLSGSGLAQATEQNDNAERAYHLYANLKAFGSGVGGSGAYRIAGFNAFDSWSSGSGIFSKTNSESILTMRLISSSYPLNRALLYELAAMLSSVTGVARCDICGQPFRPTRVPARNRRKYCEKAECKREGRKPVERASKARLKAKKL